MSITQTARIIGFFAFFLVVTPCGILAEPETAQGEEPQPWTRISAVPDLAGEWEGSIDVPVPRNDDLSLPKSSIGIIMTFQYRPGSERSVSIMKIDMERLVGDYVNAEVLRSRGLTRDSFWDMLEKNFQSLGNVSSGRYYLNLDLSAPPDELLSPSSGIVFYRDSARTRFRVVFDRNITFNLGDRGFSEIILYGSGHSPERP